MRTRSMILCAAFLLIFATQVYCDDLSQARQLFDKGNVYYKEENFAQAISQYEEVLKLGLESGPLYYNLGNAYFKDGSLGRAILNYSRAKRLMPRDADLISNLAYARSLIKGGAAAPERAWLAQIFFAAADSFSLNKITRICFVLYLILAVLAIVLILNKALRNTISYAAGLALVLFIVSLSLFYVQYNKIVLQKEAVVVSENSDSKFEPFADATTFFTLYEGEAVSIVTSEKGWLKVKRLDGKQGWIKESDILLL